MTPSVYPRECGGTEVQVGNEAEYLGLSPRVRGNRISVAQCTPSRRSIPASAGEPPGFRPLARLTKVYPRECGGTLFSMLICWPIWVYPRECGGTRDHAVGVNVPNGSIPASAGEPLGGGADGGDGAVYPRECGGTSRSTHCQKSQTGLSPRVRGNLWNFHYTTNKIRSIPASAGEPLTGCG